MATIISQFFKIIVSPSIDLHELRLPRAFSEKFGRSLSDQAYLQNPNGKEHIVDVMRARGYVWFSDGWNEFAQFHLLAFGHFLVFRYEGNSRFHVLVFDKTCSEIQYPGIEISSTDEEDQDEAYESYEDSESEEDEWKGGNKNNAALARARARASYSENPSFVVRMRQSYLSHNESRLWVPTRHAKKYLRDEEIKVIRLQLEEAVPNGRTWKVNYTSEDPTGSRLCTVRLTTGWKKFAVGNRLCVDDACIFERIDEASKTYSVRIFRNEASSSS